MKHKYLKLAVKVFETLEPKLEPIAETTKESKRKIFRELLLKERSRNGISSLIDEKDFFTNCKNEVSQLKKNFIDYIELIKHNKSALRIIKIKISNLSKTDQKKEIDTIENEMNEIYGNTTYVSITEFVNTAVRKMCLEDIYFIESVFETISFTESQQPEPELLDLSGTTAVENKITKHHYKIFSENGFTLFEYILVEYVNPKKASGRYEDLSYYYRCLFRDDFIHQKPEQFRSWFMDLYDEEFTKIKNLQIDPRSQRSKNYSHALEWHKTQKK